MHIDAAASAETLVSPAASKLSDSVSLALSADEKSNQVLITVTPPSRPGALSAKQPGKRAPLDICCVIDVSGSMGTEAPIPADPTTGAPAESTGLSVLDVVKHALRTIIATMQADDRIALVTFSDNAKVVTKLTRMTEAGRKDVSKAIKGLTLECSTNLWAGLKAGMDLLVSSSRASPTDAPSKPKSPTKPKSPGPSLTSLFKKQAAISSQPISSSGRLSTLFILTDGMPNVLPPRGHIPMLQEYLDSLDNIQPFSISTFGFGYSLDSKLLFEIAQIGGGGYGFIPDSGMVGTVFVHAVANAYSTFAPCVKLDVEVPEGVEVVVKGGHPFIKSSWGVQIKAGDLQFGQTMDLVLSLSDMTKLKDVSATLTYQSYESRVEQKVHAKLSEKQSADLASIRYHAARLNFVDVVFSVKESEAKQTAEALSSMGREITTSPILANYPDASALASDIQGEGVLALQPDHFKRWGQHYLPSLARAHQRQQCSNFKDPGLQIYGRDSAIFADERHKLDDAFMALPPPEPSVVRYDAYGASVYSPLKSMSNYYSSAGPCFAGDCLVKLASGEDVRVENLTRGMEVRTMAGVNKVSAIVRTAVPHGQGMLCRIGELKVTPWHPIVSPHDEKTWVFPADITRSEHLACDAVYSILLAPAHAAEAHAVSVSGVWCVSLGHGLTTASDGDIRSHCFLGDYERVLKDLARMDGFYEERGIVRCAGTRRDPLTHTICGFVAECEDINGKGQLHVLSQSALLA